MNKNLLKNEIKNKLATNAAWSLKALVKIYEFQTADEKAAGVTNKFNGVGFSGIDAGILSSFAVQVNSGRNLSAKQMSIVFKKMPRYWKQIMSFIPAEKLEEMEKKAVAAKVELPSTEEITKGFPAATTVA